jgi:hypothetical protein
MPKDIKSWSTCIPQDDKDKSFGQTLEEYLVPNFGGDIVGSALSVVIFGFLFGSLPASAVLILFVEKALGQVVEGGCVYGTIFLGMVLYFIITLALWFDRKRTICMDTMA